jgi:hypothetical protein
MEFLATNSKQTIFDYYYSVRKKTWSLWSTINRNELKGYETRDITSRLLDAAMAPQQEKIKMPKNRTSLAANLIGPRMSFQTMSQGSTHKKNNQLQVLQETFKPEFWGLLLSRYGRLY